MQQGQNHINGHFINVDAKSIIQLKYIYQFLHHLPYYALLLDTNHRIVASNEKVLGDNDLHDVRELFDKGPGDVFQCENAEEAGCGNSPNCRFCGIYKTLSECHEKKVLVSNPCKIIVKRHSIVKAYEFMVRCSPIIISGETFFLMTLTDVSTESRKRSLEKIFFHDIMNMVNGLRGLSMFLEEANTTGEMKEYISTLSNITERLIEVISAQRDLINAEKRELTIQLRDVCAKEIIDSVLQNSLFNGLKSARNIRLSLNNENEVLKTDPVLLIRVLINMVKNAFEAHNLLPEITLGCYHSNGSVAFFVHNHSYIEEQYAKCIFQPMCSTKGTDRGLGTYSIRLIGENYLKGKVWFKTNRDTGTTFTIEIPANV